MIPQSANAVSSFNTCLLLYIVCDVQLQEKLLSAEHRDLRPNTDFLETLARMGESRWPATSTLTASLSQALHVELRSREEQQSQGEAVLEVLNVWSSSEGATYGQLCQRLKTLSFCHQF